MHLKRIDEGRLFLLVSLSDPWDVFNALLACYLYFQHVQGKMIGTILFTFIIKKAKIY